MPRTAGPFIQVVAGRRNWGWSCGQGGRPFFWDLCALRLALAPAAAADMSSLGIDNSMPPPAPVIAPGPTTWINFLDEARVGVYAHNWIHDEGSPVDVSGELLSNPIGYANNIGGRWFSWFFNPRINIGAMINTGAGPATASPASPGAFRSIRGSSSRASLAPPLTPRGCATSRTASNTGCRWDFRELGGFGYQFDEHWDVIANVEHISHAGLCTHINPGLTQVGARIGYKFSAPRFF